MMSRLCSGPLSNSEDVKGSQCVRHKNGGAALPLKSVLSLLRKRRLQDKMITPSVVFIYQVLLKGLPENIKSRPR